MKIFNRILKGLGIGGQRRMADDLNKLFEIVEEIEGINGITISKSGSRWRISYNAPDPLNHDSLSDIVDDRSLEVVRLSDGTSFLQVKSFNSDDGTTAKGLSELLKADPDSGEVSAKGGSNYELLVRVKDGGGSVIGYMPIGEGDGVDPSGEPEPQAECGANAFPGDADDASVTGGSGSTGGGSTAQYSDAFPGNSGDGGDGSFPGKAEECW